MFVFPHLMNVEMTLEESALFIFSLLSFLKYQKVALQPFVKCLIFAAWWEKTANEKWGAYSTYITQRDQYLLFFFFCLKMLLAHLTVGWAAFQLAVYCGISLNNQTTWVKCLKSFKHFIRRASSGNRQAKRRKQKMQINPSTVWHAIQNHNKEKKRQSTFKMFQNARLITTLYNNGVRGRRDARSDEETLGKMRSFFWGSVSQRWGFHVSHHLV